MLNENAQAIFDAAEINRAILRKVTFIGYPWDPSWGPGDAFWTLTRPESETDVAIGFSDLDLVHFHTSHL